MDSVENEITKAVLAAEVVDAPASVDVKKQIPRKFQFFISTLDGSVIS